MLKNAVWVQNSLPLHSTHTAKDINEFVNYIFPKLIIQHPTPYNLI